MIDWETYNLLDAMSLATRSGVGSARTLVLNRAQLASQSQWLSRVANNIAGQRRDISIQALDERKGGKLYHNHEPPHSKYLFLTTSHRRPPKSNSPRLRLGRLLSLPRPRPTQIPNRRRLPALLLRLHPAPGLHLRRNSRIPLRAGTRARAQRREARAAILPRLGGWRRPSQADVMHRGSGR